jgi:hypothetical protein
MTYYRFEENIMEKALRKGLEPVGTNLQVLSGIPVIGITLQI